MVENIIHNQHGDILCVRSRFRIRLQFSANTRMSRNIYVGKCMDDIQ